MAGQAFQQLGIRKLLLCRKPAITFARHRHQSAWLKRYHPVPFYVALLNRQPMGLGPAVLVNDARHHRIAILPADVNASAVRYVTKARAVASG